MTLSRAADTNLDCVFVENTLLYKPILDCEKSTEQNWVSDQTWCKLAYVVKSSLEAVLGVLHLRSLPVALTQLVPGLDERWLQLDSLWEEALWLGAVVGRHVQGTPTEVKDLSIQKRIRATFYSTQQKENTYSMKYVSTSFTPPKSLNHFWNWKYTVVAAQKAAYPP